MYPLICHVNLCATVLNTAPEREAHAREMHGFPSCTKCLNKRYSNINLFEQHLNTMHLKEQCRYPNCTAEFWASEELEHVTTAHGYPECSVCHKKCTSVTYFNKHNLVCTDPVITCELCSESLPQSEMKAHALIHGYPSCAYCKKVWAGNETLFVKHAKSCQTVVSECMLCSKTFNIGDIRDHAISHGYPTCPYCTLIFGHTEVHFYTHVKNCRNDKPYSCSDCGQVFATRRLYGLHRDGECVPTGQVGLSFTAYAKQLHGTEMDMVYGNSRLRVKWDLSQYVDSLGPLSLPAHRVGLPLLMETERERIYRETRRGGGNAQGIVDESGGLTGVEGGPFRLDENPRLFQQVRTSATSHAWLFRLCGTPWELGGGKTSALMMDQRLCLVDYFTKRSAYDVWIYLVSRFCKYTKTMYEVNEVKGLLTNCELPAGVSCQYRDLDFVRIFSGTAIMNAENERVGVKYRTRGGVDRGVVTEVSKMARKRKRVVFFQSNMPAALVVPPPPVADAAAVQAAAQAKANVTTVDDEPLLIVKIGKKTITYRRMMKFEGYFEAEPATGSDEAKKESTGSDEAKEGSTGSDEAKEGVDTAVTILANPTAVSCVRMPGGVPVDCVQMAVTGSPTGPASIVNAVRAAMYALPPHEHASNASSSSVCDNVELWSETCWEMIYMVYRDFMTYFVETQSFERLRLFSNFTNDSPHFIYLEELLYRFRPFIVRDMNSSACARASALFYGLQAEYRCLRGLFQRGIRMDRLCASDLVEYHTDHDGFISKSVHRSVRRQIHDKDISF